MERIRFTTRITALSVLFTTFIPILRAADPVWWSTHGVKNTATASNLSPATIGQAKHMVAKALVELQPKLPPAAFAGLQSDVAAVVNLALPVSSAEFEAQKAVLALGQLKAISKPFYDRLRTLDNVWVDIRMQQSGIRIQEPSSSNPYYYSAYPWTETVADDVNRAIATVGQLKAVFSLPLESWVTPDELNPALPWGPADTDGDGLSDVTEIALGTSPVLADTDGDGVPDHSDAFPLDPTRSASSAPIPGDITGPVVSLIQPTTATFVSGP